MEPSLKVDVVSLLWVQLVGAQSLDGSMAIYPRWQNARRTVYGSIVIRDKDFNQFAILRPLNPHVPARLS